MEVYMPTYPKGSHRRSIMRFLFLFSFAVGTLAQATPQAKTPTEAPWKLQAQRAAQGAMKLDVRQISTGVRVGGTVSIEISLLNAANEPAVSKQPTAVEVEVTGPSGKAIKQTLTIPSGQSSAQFNFEATVAGLHNVKVRELHDTLLPGGNSVLVIPAATSKKPAKNKPSAFHSAPGHQAPRLVSVAARFLSTTKPLATVSVSQQDSAGVPANPPPAVPSLLFTNSSGKDEILADGKDFARVKVFFMDPQGNPAKSDIKIWLRWSNGEMHPQPLIIRKGKYYAEGQWVSSSPVDAQVSLVTSAPQYPVQGDSDFKVAFVPPIYGIATPTPGPLQLSLVDSMQVSVHFYDDQGRTVQTSKLRRITFSSTNPTLHLDPSFRDVKPNESDASIFLLPTWSGQSSLDISTPGYDQTTVVVEVAMWLVIVLCLSGGVIGGIAAKDTVKGSLWWRIFLGLTGAIVLVWFCVFAVLPGTHSAIAHNLVSVFVVGILGGYGGTHALDYVGRKLGLLN
jgi:hypothetical protein